MDPTRRQLVSASSARIKLRRTLLALSRRSRELEDANAALRAAQERVVRSERLAALGSLAASLAHDLNNPLSVVMSGVSALREIAGSAFRQPAPVEPALLQGVLGELDAVSEEILAASRRMIAIGRDLRLFGFGAPATADRVRAEDAVRSAVALATAPFAVAPIVEVEGGGAAAVGAPAHLVTLVLLSIVGRALHAAGPTGRVRVVLGAADGSVEIAVHDDGPRIPDALLPRVFEPFGRIDPSYQTAGLGLAVAAGIVHGLGGHIGVDGHCDRGACFRVRLPLAEP